MRLQRSPIGLRFLQMEQVLLGMRQSKQVVFRLLFNDDIAANSEIDNRSGDVSHVDGVVD